MDDFNYDLDKGAFLILPIIGMTLVVLGIFIIVVAYYPDIIPYLISVLSPPEISQFLLNYYNAFKPSMLDPPYMLLIGLASIGAGSCCMVYEYRLEQNEKLSRFEK